MKEIIMGVLVLLIGLFLINVSFQDYRKHSELEKLGETVTSEPLTKYTQRTKNGSTVGYSLNANFVTKSGSHQTCHGNVKENMITRLKENPALTVRYVPTNPSNCQVEGDDNSGNWFLSLLGVSLTLGAGAFLYNRYSVR